MRFLDQIWNIAAWDPHSVDLVAAYVSLLHSEAEHTLECMVQWLLENAALKTKHYRPDPVLINCCMYYRSEMHRSLGEIGLIPERKELKADQAKLLAAWETFGASKYWDALLEGNHGAGRKYVEKLFHPLGIVLTPKSFARLSSAGVTEVLDVSATTMTMVTEFVVLRGGAVHAGTARFRDEVKSDSPQGVAKRGEGVVQFVNEMATALARGAW